MEIERYGVRLTRLTIDKIEMVRQWRNTQEIRQYMIYKGEITPQMQQQWFKEVDNQFNSYNIIGYEGEDIGLVNAKNIDWIGKNSEVGIFIAKPEYLNSDIAIRASMCALELFFELLGLEWVYGRVIRENVRAIRFNHALGFVDVNSVASDDNIVTMHLTKENYYKRQQYLQDLML